MNWIVVANQIKKENADLVVFDWWHPFFSFCHYTISKLIQRKYASKILFITENVISHEGHIIDRILTKIGLSNASKFLALSEEVVNKLKNFSYNKKVYRSELPVYNWYKKDEEFQKENFRTELGFDKSNKILLFFGYVRKYKGLDILINALRPLVDWDQQIRLLVVGEFYEDTNQYLKQINELDLESYIKIISDYVPNEAVNKYFEISDVVVLPYRSATQSGILNIAYGAHKPVVVTRVGGLAESVEDTVTGIIVENATKEEICEGIKKFFSLNDSINFSLNIKNKTENNKFDKIPEIFTQILSDEI
jgi:glycosyltransferase involved in cell wall biosynthesis